MSTNLELCQRLRQETDIGGTGPSTVVSQTGELKRIVDWVSEAYVDIQNRHANWRWLRHEFALHTHESDDTYASTDCTDRTSAAAISRFSHWRLNDFHDPPKIRQASYQMVDVGGAKTSASATGLTNDATVYTASISVGGTANAITVTGSAAQTYATLITQINNDLTGADIELSNGDLRVIASYTTGDDIAITDTDLFSTLTGYVAIDTAVAQGNETWMIWTDWDSFKSVYRIGTQSNGAPIHITVDPQNNIVIGPKPNGGYLITGDFYRSAQVLAANSDTPEMPSQFHRLIVYTALLNYGYRESAPEALENANRQSRKLMRQLEINQLPTLFMGGPLA